MISCELKLLRDTLKFTDNIEGKKEWPHSWPHGKLTYRLNNYTKDIEKQKHQTKAVTVAFRAWQLRMGKLKFRRERDPDATVDIDISFQPQAKFASKGVLAHAVYPGQGKESGDIEINDEWNWVTSSKYQLLSTPPLVPILIHEIGHSLGLTHDNLNMESIMYPSFNLGKTKNTLHENDVFRIQGRYGERNLPQRVIDYFRRRRNRASDFR